MIEGYAFRMPPTVTPFLEIVGWLWLILVYD